jgi:hypothetical protein
MKEETIRIARQELYEQVWAQPLYKLAKNYHMSDVGLAKLCRRLKIPLPGNSYWQRVKFGKPVTRPPLPVENGVNEAKIRVMKQEDPPVDQNQYEEAQNKIVFEGLSENRIRVPSRLASPHPYVALTEKILRNAKHENSGMIYSRMDCLDISVSRGNLGRALRIMNALIKALEARGFKVLLPKKDESNPHSSYVTSVSILGETIEFGLREFIKRTEREPVPDEKKRYSWYYERYDYTPSGKLILSIKNSIGTGLRKNWSDGKKHRVEDSLNDFVVGLIKAAVDMRAWKLERERQHREWQEKERLRFEEEKRRREQEELFQCLSNDTSAWHKSRNIRAYADAVKHAVIKEHGEILSGSKLDKWLAWAYSQADRTDPLVQNYRYFLNANKLGPSN